MTPPRIPTRLAPALAFVAALALFAGGCGGNPPEVDTAETIRPDAAKPAPAPSPAPAETPAAKDAPKG